MLRLTLFAALAAGCYSPNIDAGRFQCSDKMECPGGHHCASDGFCWKDGTDPPAPDLAVAQDLAVAPDLSVTADLASFDLSSSDLTSPPDLAPQVFPPQSLWLSSGGGSPTSNGKELSISIGGTMVYGTATATSGATVTFGYFCDDTFQ